VAITGRAHGTSMKPLRSPGAQGPALHARKRAALAAGIGAYLYTALEASCSSAGSGSGQRHVHAYRHHGRP
jgi:hypothetical protein